VIVRTSFAKLADPTRRDEIAGRIARALEGAGHAWSTIGAPADPPSEVWDIAVLVGCPDHAVAAEVHRRVITALEDGAVVFKAWSFSAAP
jgi:hypothetical protein